MKPRHTTTVTRPSNHHPPTSSSLFSLNPPLSHGVKPTLLVLPPCRRHNVRSSSPSKRGVTAMRISADLCALALRSLVGGACKAVGGEVGGATAEHVVGFLTRHFVDHSQRMLGALRTANDRAWRALE